MKKIKSFPVLHINENISKTAQEFADKDINAKPKDLFIGATAHYHKMPLYTLNKKDFAKFKLKII